jgi:uncharacterized protein (DUF1800 family)
MPTTIDRRSFFKKLTSKLENFQPGGKFTEGLPRELGGKKLFDFGTQELPPVPPAANPITIQGGLDPYTGPWEYDQAAHLLRRTTFGLKKSDLDLLLTMTMSEAVDHLLTEPAQAPAPPVNNYNNDDFTDPDVPAGETWIDADFNVDAEFWRIESFRGWWTELMLNTEASILERMTLFWHNHFATQSSAIFYGKINYKHNVLLRSNALGNFRELTKQVTIDPMMLIYLNGYLNSKYAPDENYARELQELFTIGKEYPSQYTEDDVVQAARVLTGWRINWLPGESFFFPPEHDAGNKQFSAFYDNTVIQGQTLDGEAELDALLDMIFARPEVAKFLCRKLYRWFVYYHIDDEVEQNVIEPLADIFRNNNYDIKPVLQTLLSSEHFYNALYTGCFIKTPIDIVVGTLRSFNLSIPASTLWDDFNMKYILTWLHSIMQMVPGEPPNVAGWQAFRQSPQYYRMWINGDTIRNRNWYTDILTLWHIDTDNDQLKIDHIAFASQFDHPEDPKALVDDMTRLLLPQPISEQKKLLLKNVLLSGLPNDSYWTVAWFEYQNNPSDPMAFEVVNFRLSILTKYILSLAEYQLA